MSIAEAASVNTIRTKRRAAHSLDIIEERGSSLVEHRTMEVSYHPIHRYTRDKHRSQLGPSTCSV